MTEYHRPVDRANILAHALIETRGGREYSDKQTTTAYAVWDIEQRGLTCHLKRVSDTRGTIFLLSVFRTDEYYEDVPEDEYEEEFDEFDDDEVDEGYEVEPTETYELSFLSPQTIVKGVYADNIFLDKNEVRDRVLWLLNQGYIDPDELQAREAEDRRFWKLVGSYALSGADVEKKLAELTAARRRRRARREFLHSIDELDYGLSRKETLDAMDDFYISDHGKNVIARNNASEG